MVEEAYPKAADNANSLVLARDVAFIGVLASRTLFGFGRREHGTRERNPQGATANLALELTRAKLNASLKSSYRELEEARQVSELTRRPAPRFISDAQTTVKTSGPSGTKGELEMLKGDLSYRRAPGKFQELGRRDSVTLPTLSSPDGAKAKPVTTREVGLPGRNSWWQMQQSRLRRELVFVNKQVELLSLLVRHPRVPWPAKIAGGCAIAYIFSPIQLIPSFIPLIGQLDDLAVLFLGTKVVRKFAPAPVLEECEARAELASSSRVRKVEQIFNAVRQSGSLPGLPKAAKSAGNNLESRQS